MVKRDSTTTVLLVLLVALVAYIVYCKYRSGKSSGGRAAGDILPGRTADGGTGHTASGRTAGSNLSGRTADGGTGHTASGRTAGSSLSGRTADGGTGHTAEGFSSDPYNGYFAGGFDPQAIAAAQGSTTPSPFGGSPQPGLAGFRQAMSTPQRRAKGKALDASLAGSGEVYGTTGDNYYGGNNTYDQKDYGAHVHGDWGSRVVDQVAGPHGSRMRQNHQRWANEMSMWSSPSMIVDHLDVFNYQPKTGAAGFVRFRPTGQGNPTQIQSHIDPHDFNNHGDQRRFYF